MTQKQLLLSNAFLLAALAPLNTFCMRGKADYVRSPLHKAAWIGNTQEATQILKEDPDPDKRDGDKNTPLHLAVNAGHNYMAQFLLEYGANKNAQNAELNTPLHSTARWDRTDIVALLLEAGADPRTKNKMGELPTDIAKEFGHEEVARLLDTATEHINGHVLPFLSREAAALRMMIGHTAREKAIATQS